MSLLSLLFERMNIESVLCVLSEEEHRHIVVFCVLLEDQHCHFFSEFVLRMNIVNFPLFYY